MKSTLTRLMVNWSWHEQLAEDLNSCSTAHEQQWAPLHAKIMSRLKWHALVLLLAG